MTTVMPPEVQANIDGIPPGHRPLFERLHRLILTAHPGAQVTLSYKMPAYKAGNRRLYAGAANMGILVCGWQKDRDGGFTSRHPELVTSKATLQLRDGDAAGINNEDFLGLAAPPWPPDPNPAGVPAKARLPGHQRKAWAAASQPSCLNAAALRPTGVSARIIARDAVDAAPLTADMPAVRPKLL